MSGKKAKALRRLHGPVLQASASEYKKIVKGHNKARNAIALGMLASYLGQGALR